MPTSVGLIRGDAPNTLVLGISVGPHRRPYAVLAAASAAALRSLRGTAFSGLLRASRLTTPAASRKRVTRSDGCAPLASQALTLSISSLRRASLSFGSSGLK